MIPHNFSATAPELVEALLVNMIERLDSSGIPGQEPQGKPWLRATVQAILNLPWHDTDLPDGRRPLQPSTAAELLLVMLQNLDDDTPPPNSVNPTGDGGTTAQWHLQDFDLEIFCEPGEEPEYLLRTGQIQFEGPVYDQDDPDRLRIHARLMPRRNGP